MNIPPVILNAGKKHTATLVFLHGLGDTGMGWAGALNTIKPDYLKIICPTASMLPVTINGGALMPAWYDITSLDENSKQRGEEAGVLESVKYLVNIVNGEMRYNIRPERVIIGGFSQGGAVALRTALTSGLQFGGCIGLSCYLPGDIDNIDVPDTPNIQTPIFQAHGDSDEVVTYSRGVKTSKILEKHFSNHKLVTYKGEKPFSCKECGQAFSDKSNLGKHEKRHEKKREAEINGPEPKTENKVKNHTCGTCGKCFDRPSKLHIHELTHFGFKPFSCDTCGMTFSQKNSLNYHQQIHINKGEKKLISCVACGLNGKNPRWLRDHKKRCTGEKPKCEVCGKEFERVCALLSHKKMHTEESSSFGKYWCHLCPRKFEFVKAYTKHKKICKGVFPCEICSANFTSLENLQKHKDKYHSKECSWCGVVIDNEDDMKAHVDLEHSEGGTLAHMINDETDIKQNNIKEENDEIIIDDVKSLNQNTNDRLGDFLSGLITCDLCDISFTNKADLNDHKEDHLSSISFPCDTCSKSFLSISDYTVHVSSEVHIANVAAAEDIQIIDDDENEKNDEITEITPTYDLENHNLEFPCDLCNESFTDLTEFNKHKADHVENVDYVIIEDEMNEDENTFNDDMDPPDNEEEMAEINENDIPVDIKEEMIET